MLSKQFNRIAIGGVLVLLVGLMTPALSLAAGSTPNAPLAVSAQMRHLDVGGQDWYAFTTAGADSNNNPSHVLIVLHAVPDGSATFKVWTAEGLKEKATEDPGKPVYAMGEGTTAEYQDGGKTLDRYGGDLVWANGFNVGGTFYVQVAQAGPAPSNYLLTITGDNISFPANAAAASQGQPAQAVSAAVTNSAIPAAMVPGSGMSTAMTPNGQMNTLNPGGQQWYAVTLGRPAQDGDKQNLNVELMAPAGGAKFTVWTAERLAEHAASDDPDRKAPPIGQGTVSTYQDGNQTLQRDNGSLTWSGDASYGGTFYIVVESTSSAPIQYALNTGVAQR
jgi:hypothetical protein